MLEMEGSALESLDGLGRALFGMEAGMKKLLAGALCAIALLSVAAAAEAHTLTKTRAKQASLKALTTIDKRFEAVYGWKTHDAKLLGCSRRTPHLVLCDTRTVITIPAEQLKQLVGPTGPPVQPGAVLDVTCEFTFGTAFIRSDSKRTTTKLVSDPRCT
jgi:hypothetical protein